MTDNVDVYITILGMAVVTYLTRISGFYISNRISDLRPGLARTLAYIPGTIIVSIIAPQILSVGSPGLIAAAVCLAAALVFKNLIAVMVTGVVTISLLRHFIFI